ncbi:uncharacterized protein LOC110847669 isoform X1 [Folsomia candida]|uniref:uncharacterized protein LOC110847669 isoform X1 n=1 Tax=Folsomia candida TaxID=158441 RepID=UPI000B9007F0|nr:uncharacterized protein LOC110847669 isoform X1 [Folsomia candida]
MSSTSPVSPPPKRKRFPLGEELYAQLECGADMDLTFFVGKSKFPAHRHVVAAASAEFKTRLDQQMGGTSSSGFAIVLSPTDISMSAMRAFIKAIYFQEVDASRLSLDTLLEVVTLCDKYLDQRLLNDCIDSISKIITEENCREIYEFILPMLKCQRLADRAFEVLIRNPKLIEKMLEGSGERISFSTWHEILMLQGPKIENLSEEIIFTHLLRWKDKDSSRRPGFKNLLSLVRFPIMSLQFITEVVEPSKALTRYELKNIKLYIAGGADNIKCNLAFITHSRMTKIARNEAQFSLMLQNAQPGDFIQLLPNEYMGPFETIHCKQKITIKGFGESTVLTSPIELGNDNILCIWGSNDMHVSDLCFVSKSPSYGETGKSWIGLECCGSRNRITNIAFQNCTLRVSGNYNKMENITCDTGYTGIVVSEAEISGEGKGSLDNFLSNVTLKNLNFGISILQGSCGTIIRNAKFINVQYGMTLEESNDNSIMSVDYQFSETRINEEETAIQILGSSGNIVSYITCVGHNAVMTNVKGKSTIPDKFAIVIQAENSPEPKNNIVTHCTGGPVKLGGEGNTLTSINAGEIIILSGQYHKLEACLAKRCVNNNSVNVTLTKCNFKI